MTGDEKPTRKKGGRPRLYPGTEKRPTLTFRVRAGMHAQLTEAAEKSQRSLSEEIERRLEDSFRAEDLINIAQKAATSATLEVIRDLFGGENYYEIGRMLGVSLDYAMHATGNSGKPVREISENAPARQFVTDYIIKILNHEIDKGSGIVITKEMEAEKVGRLLAERKGDKP